MVRTVLFPVSYSAYGTMPGRTNRLSYTLAEMTEISIVEVDPQFAPIAVSWKVPDEFGYNGRQAMWARDEAGGQHTVYHEGRHWVTVLDWTKGDPSPQLLTDDFLAKAPSGEFNRLLGFSPPTGSKRRFTVVEGDPEKQFPDIDCSHRKDAKRTALGLDFISVGGLLYQRCDQPVFKLIIERGDADGNKPISRGLVVDAFENRDQKMHVTVRTKPIPLGMQDDLASLSPTMADVNVAHGAEPTIHLPESISATDSLRVAADFHVLAFLTDNARAFYSTHDRDFLEAYLAMRDIDQKLEFVTDRLGEWAKTGLSTVSLHRAIEYLDDVPISVDLAAQSVARSRLTP
ncbi:hypothetical protein [Rhizobium sp. BK176]|uniref:hypothetical protein n=1 Tax=Rhizobium sp. BK176 TaxID=2587071 RepID=UPI00216826DC|nr:hypothetical protein [Rhizobium sp. BK176]MCS4089638.1 hypothetical protein [Rhizobium sp. BK176]